MMEGPRFIAVAIVGLAIDLTIALIAVRLLALPLWLASLAGFTVAAAVNYAIHELWTFRTGARRLSSLRALRYASSLVAILAARVAAVTALAATLGDGQAFFVLVAGAGASLGINFLVSKHYVFRPEPDKKDHLP